MGDESWNREYFLGPFLSRAGVISEYCKIPSVLMLLQIKKYRNNALHHLEVHRPRPKSNDVLKIHQKVC